MSCFVRMSRSPLSNAASREHALISHFQCVLSLSTRPVSSTRRSACIRHIQPLVPLHTYTCIPHTAVRMYVLRESVIARLSCTTLLPSSKGWWLTETILLRLRYSQRVIQGCVCVADTRVVILVLIYENKNKIYDERMAQSVGCDKEKKKNPSELDSRFKTGIMIGSHNHLSL